MPAEELYDDRADRTDHPSEWEPYDWIATAKAVPHARDDAWEEPGEETCHGEKAFETDWTALRVRARTAQEAAAEAAAEAAFLASIASATPSQRRPGSLWWDNDGDAVSQKQGSRPAYFEAALDALWGEDVTDLFATDVDPALVFGAFATKIEASTRKVRRKVIKRERRAIRSARSESGAAIGDQEKAELAGLDPIIEEQRKRLRFMYGLAVVLWCAVAAHYLISRLWATPLPSREPTCGLEDVINDHADNATCLWAEAPAAFGPAALTSLTDGISPFAVVASAVHNATCKMVGDRFMGGMTGGSLGGLHATVIVGLAT